MTTALMPTATRPAQSLSDVFDRVFGPTYSVFNRFGTQGYQGLPTNVYELGDTYQVAMLIPGIDPQSIQVTALGNTITVAGGMQLSTPDRAGQYGRNSRRASSAARSDCRSRSTRPGSKRPTPTACWW